jgi:hypothetical protein
MSTFAFTAAPTAPEHPLGLTVFLGNSVVFDVDQLTEPQQITVEFDDDVDGVKYTVRILLKNKTSDHTTIDSQGNIVSDSVIELSGIELNHVSIDQLFFEKAVYTHSFNSDAEPIKDQIFGIMGCNGTVEFDFAAPSYIWLLENM